MCGYFWKSLKRSPDSGSCWGLAKTALSTSRPILPPLSHKRAPPTFKTRKKHSLCHYGADSRAGTTEADLWSVCGVSGAPCASFPLPGRAGHRQV